MPKLEIFCDYHSPNLWFGRWDDGKKVEKFSFIAVRDPSTWARRHPWEPSSAVEEQLCSEANRVVIALMHPFQAAEFGIPPDVHQYLDRGELTAPKA